MQSKRFSRAWHDHFRNLTLMSDNDDALSERSDKFLVPGSSDNCCLSASSRFRRLQKRGSNTLQQVKLSLAEALSTQRALEEVEETRYCFLVLSGMS